MKCGSLKYISMVFIVFTMHTDCSLVVFPLKCYGQCRHYTVNFNPLASLCLSLFSTISHFLTVLLLHASTHSGINLKICCCCSIFILPPRHPITNVTISKWNPFLCSPWCQKLVVAIFLSDVSFLQACLVRQTYSFSYFIVV